MKKQEIIKIEEYLFTRLSELYTTGSFSVDYNERSIRTPFHRLSFAVYGKYNNYITMRPSINIISDQIAEIVCNIFNIDDDVCFHSLLNVNLIQKGEKGFLETYPEGYVYHKVSTKEDIGIFILEYGKFMKKGGSEFIDRTNSLKDIESFLNDKISKYTLTELSDPLVKNNLRKFYKDPRIIRSGIIARYLLDKTTARQLANKYKILFNDIETVKMIAEQITDFYSEHDSDSV